MTKKEAVENHRKMWLWIAEETLKRKKKMEKEDYFKEVRPGLKSVLNDCFCCQYVSNIGSNLCIKCPIIWDKTYCVDSRYCEWLFELDYNLAAKYANDIANLPERPDKEFDILECDNDENFSCL